MTTNNSCYFCLKLLFFKKKEDYFSRSFVTYFLHDHSLNHHNEVENFNYNYIMKRLKIECKFCLTYNSPLEIAS